jgi:ABC-type bacteriocin/lantibiotic exporter with double-glycine peptidase domain
MKNIQALLVIVVCSIPSIGAELSSNQRDLSIGEVRSLVMKCGPNALYLFLKCHNHQTDLKEIESRLEITDRGVTLLDLKRVANALGLQSEVNKISLQELENCHLPVIAHLPRSYLTEGTGHFVLVYDLVKDGSRRGIWFIDPTTGHEVRYRWERMPLKWDGYVLQTKKTVFDNQVFLWVALATTWISLFLWLKAIRFRHVQRSSIAACVFFMMCFSITASTVVAQDSSAEEKNTCRTAQSDGVNTLFLFLRSHGVDVRRSELAVMFQKYSENPTSPSFGDLVRVGNKFLPVRVARIEPNQIVNLTLPTITHQQNNRGGGGAFNLVLYYPIQENGNSTLISGATGTLTEISVDDFRRGYSGFALTTNQTKPSWLVVVASNVLFLSLLLFVTSHRS